jgi:hypothetical protein
VDIVEHLPIKARGFDLFRRVSIFPEPILSILIQEQLQYAGFRDFQVAFKFHGDKPFKVAQEPRHVRGRGDEMNVVQHKNISVQFQTFVFLAITQRLGQNLPAVMPVEQVIPALDRQGQVIRAGIQVDGDTA